MKNIKEWRTKDTYGDRIDVLGDKIYESVTVSFTEGTETATMFFDSRSDIDKFIKKLRKARKHTYGN